uniref:MMS19 nucleotide excision repair protein n=1 Tax=Scophthalmus maximus TaxID=52904 RepID=A0A8D3C5C2_SCOMX
MAADGALLLSLVEEFVSGLQDSKAKDTAAGVRNGQFTVLQLVEALGLSLTSSQPHTRARGVQLLSEVLHECYGNLTEREVEVLIAFYENRLKDHYVITPSVLQGLRALTKCAALPPGSAVSMLRSLFQDVHVQLKGLGADFVFGFVQSMDGERDPRNLLLAFQIAKNIVHRGYDLGKFTEELFEVTSCYFPIDFSPPPNDPHGITKEELIETLRAVLTGTPKFAEFLLPLIIEKLDSDVQSAKLDSLQTLTACVSQYEHKDLAEFLEGLWTSLRREVFQTSSERIESAGLAAVTALTSCLSRSVLNSDSEDSLSTFLDLVLKDCKHHLCEPDLKLVWPSAKLLQAACSASSRASHATTAAVMPSLIEQYSSRTQAMFFVIETLTSVILVQNKIPDQHLPLLSSLLCSEPMDEGDNRAASGQPSHHAMRQRCLSALAAVSTRPGVVRESTPVLLEVLGSVHVEVPQIDQLMSQLEELSCTCSHPLSYNSAAKCFSGLVNKRPQGDSLDSLVQTMMKRVCRELDSSSSPVRTQALTLMIWVSKALLLRYHPLSTALTDKLFSLLDDTDLGAAAADGFSLLMSDSSDVLNRGCHADVRIMYRQRFFSENSAKLVQGFNAAPQEKKSNYLKALSNIVNKLPKQVQITELPALLSLLLEALSCPDQGVQLSTLSCLEPVLVDPPPALIQQLEALVSRLLALTSSPTMSVKIASMRCIHAISRFPEHEILPFRARVLRALARPLDDRKRLVRSEAVQARGEWFLVGSPGGR